jgi:hypothetical protein
MNKRTHRDRPKTRQSKYVEGGVHMPGIKLPIKCFLPAGRQSELCVTRKAS